MAGVSKDDADSIVEEPKVVSGNIQWRRLGRGFRMSEVIVLGANSGRTGRLAGYIGPENRSFVLLYRNQPIRKWTVHHHHKLPDGLVIYGPHKHLWDDDYEDEIAYVPTDIEVGDANVELRDFLRECNIEVLGAIQVVGLT